MKEPIRKEQLLFVYDRALHIQLKEAGFKFFTTAISNDNKRFWLYPRYEATETILKQHLNN